MNLPTTNSTHYFVPVDGMIKLIKEMPEFPSALDQLNPHDVAHYENVILKPVIENAIEVSNQEEVSCELVDKYGVDLQPRYVYSLQCRVEMKETPDNRDGKLVALVTFDQASEPKRTMTKKEAIQAMKEGKKVTHRYFSENEWILYDYDTLKISEKGDGWIEVEERLPQNNEEVLCYSRDFRRMRQNSYSEHTDQDSKWFVKNFSHWRPLPEPPRKREVK